MKYIVISSFPFLCSSTYISFFRGFTAFFRKTYHCFPQTRMCTFRPIYIPPRRIQFRCRRSHDQASSCAFFLRSKIFYIMYHVTATDIPTIQYQFKWRLFSRRPCTCPYPRAGPQSRLQRLDLIIQLSSISFNFVFHSIRDALSSMGGVCASV